MKKAEIIKLLKPKCNGYDLPISLNIELIANLLVENQKPAIAVNGCCTELCDDKDKVFICENETCMIRKCKKCGEIA